MRRFLSIVIILTLLSLGYVCQQVKLFEYSYRIGDNNKRLCLLIDRNEALRYNVASLESPVSLGQKLARNKIELAAQQNWSNIKLARAVPEETQQQKDASAYENSFKIATRVLINAFTPKAEAIAQELE
ncbi:MAG: hypothetical protein V2A72_04750 [Candidatus Omnitrophota bacterium]